MLLYLTYDVTPSLYKDLFYIGPFYHTEFPPEMEFLIVLDLDLEFK